MHGVLNGEPISGHAWDLARLRLLFPPRSRLSSAVFLLLWQNRGKTVSNQDMMAGLPEYFLRGAPMSDLRDPLVWLQDFIRKKAWPVGIRRIPGGGARLVLKDPGWSWEQDPHLDEEYVGAARFLLAMPELELRAARVLNELAKSLGRAVSQGDLANALRSMTGKRVDTGILQRSIHDVRRVLKERGSPLEVEPLHSVGWRLWVREPHAASQDLLEVPEQVDFDAITWAAGYLGIKSASLSTAFLVLLQRRAAVVTPDRMAMVFDEVNGVYCLKNTVAIQLVKLRRVLNKCGSPFRIFNHHGLGWRLALDEGERPDRKIFKDDDSLSTFRERRAELASYFPGAQAQAMAVLQMLRDANGRTIEHADISSFLLDELGIDLSHGSVKYAISQARKALRQAEVPASIICDRDIGFALTGQLENWINGTVEPPKVRETSPALRQLRPRSVPSYKHHLGRMFS